MTFIHLASIHPAKPWHMIRYDDSLLSGLLITTGVLLVLLVISAIFWRYSFPKSTSRTVLKSTTIALLLISCFALGGWASFLVQDGTDARTVQQAASEQLGLKLGLDGRGTDPQGNHWHCIYSYSVFLRDSFSCSGFIDNGVTVDPTIEIHTLTGYFSK